MAAKKAKKTAPPEVRFKTAPNLYDQYKAHETSEVKARNKVFNEKKRQNPPGDLPPKMKDHELKGRLKGIRECHLDDDVLLLYTHDKGIIHMLYICTHDDLYGGRGEAIAKVVKRLIRPGPHSRRT